MADSMSDGEGAASRAYPSRPFIAVSVAVFREGKVLIAERMKPPLAGVFTLPGGMVENGERLEAAASRELREETGIAAALLGFTRHVEIIDRDKEGLIRFHAIVCPFAALWREGEPTGNAEIGRLLFIDPSDLARYPTTQGLADIVARAAEIVRRNG
jgi:8-oxo-dGTP diphosphatase